MPLHVEPVPIARERAAALRPNGSSHDYWEIFAVWILAVFSFAALLYCLWSISAKCQVNQPF